MRCLYLFKKVFVELLHPYTFEVRPIAQDNGFYCLDVSDILAREIQEFEQGIPIIRQASIKYHNPVTVSFYALYLYDRYLREKDESQIEEFLNQAHWLQIQQKSGAFTYPVSVPQYAASPGWRSAMAQGLAISVFIRAFKLTHKPEYRDTALQAAAILVKPIEEGGCSSFDVDGLPYLEEIAVNPPAHILNGSIFALWGLYDLEVISNEYVTIKDKVVRRLARELPNYDLGYWSRYDLLYDAPASRGYHILHIAQLESLYLLTKEPVFQQYSVIWRNYLKAPHKRARAFVKKGLFVLRRGRK